ncbi:substrate-binding domain-containing protein [Nocardioides sp. LHD-245]|uniref:substrate-binding domain-containing protein n=1 Tax=Nocardioides sp. LHD-245 TaxID=3051387 RepID=UPI0027DF86B1|nr:substrate-binding domain-containing protein [Nocardioides sp. LHD-245]
MSVRKSLTAAFAAAVATSAVTLIASPAHAVYTPHPEDSKATPVAADLIGGGSDTTMLSLFQAAKVWNEGAKADYGQTFDVASFAAVPQPAGGTIKLPTNGDQNRPNGSSDGKDKMRSDANFTDLDFARSSDALKAAEAADLWAIPFALDTVAMAVSNSTASHAPQTLSAENLKKIYTCEITNWSAVGGSAGTIKPFVPQSGSGTEKFFKSKVLTGGADYGSCVKSEVGGVPIQEHTDGPVKNDPDAIVPISQGRAGLIPGNTVRLIGGEVAFKRAVYNAVRKADVGKTDIQKFFGSAGFLCSDAATLAIAQGGLTQLATPANGGACGTNVESTTNFATNDLVETATALTGTSTAAGINLSAKVSGSSQPTGSVSFYEGATLLQANVPLVSGQAPLLVRTPSAGAHTYKAVFKPTNTKYLVSEGSVTLTWTAPSTGPSPALAAAQAQLDKAQAKVKKLKKQVKKATGAKKVKLTKKLKKAKKSVKTAKAAVAAAS